MKSLYMRIVAIYGLALILSSLALGWIWIGMEHRGRLATTEGGLRLVIQQAREAYESGGQRQLARLLAETDAALDGTRYFTDLNGRDLVTGEDRSRMHPTDDASFMDTITGKEHQTVSVINSPDGKYRLIVLSPPRRTGVPMNLSLLLIPVAFILLGGMLSIGIVSPLKRLSQTVDRFGRGDLSARVKYKRKDEIGILAQSFNNMADRIETLLNTERRLLQDVSHELRSPLMRLGFAAELMKNSNDPETAAKRLQREIARLSGLVESLLEVNSSDGDPTARLFESVPVVPLIEEIVDDGRFEAEAHNVKIKAQINSKAIVHGNPELLRRAIENVLRNAIRYADPASEIQMQVDDGEGCTTISVRDFGPGVPEELLKRIFDPFFRVDKSRDRAAGGTGLGLSIARRAILLHHGDIAAENAYPGLRVKIALPAVAA
jgi:signal transduction histidine kinase